MTTSSSATISTSVGPDIDAAALLDALPDAAAVLDRDGRIVAVNRIWRMFCLDNGGTAESTGVGVSYLDVCARAAAAGCADAAVVEAGLRAVLDGDTVECDLEYPCPAPSLGRWFVLRVTPIEGSAPGVLVSHVNISRRKMAERELERKASEDPLTGLANRMRFTQRLTAALTVRTARTRQADVGVLYFDLDRFKYVNDTFGHAAGDEVLQSVAGRLSLLTRSQDTIARLGGDEFAAVVPRITAGGLAGLAERMESSLAVPHLIHGRPVEVGASIGSYLAAAGEGAADCVQRADEAMYAVKRRRKPAAGPSAPRWTGADRG